VIAAIGMVKDEADVISRTLEHLAAQGVERIYLAENDSTDGTWELVRDLRDTAALAPCELNVISDPVVGYWQSRKMTELAYIAALAGATWVVPFDADELWSFGTTTLAEGFAYYHADRLARGLVLEASVHNHYRTPLDAGGHPFDTMRWRDPEPLPLPKVAFTADRRASVHAGNHGADHPGRIVQGSGLVVEHYPYRSAEQFLSKVRNGSRAYAETDLPRSTGQHWREYGEMLAEHGAAGVREHYRRAFVIDDPVARGLEPQ
jgi:hypothetical protein